MLQLNQTETMIDTHQGLRKKILTEYSMKNSKRKEFFIIDRRYYLPLTGLIARLPACKLELRLPDTVVERFYTVDKFDEILEEFAQLIEGKTIKKIDAITGKVVSYE